jgi:hypothetical protein
MTLENKMPPQGAQGVRQEEQQTEMHLGAAERPRPHSSVHADGGRSAAR